MAMGSSGMPVRVAALLSAALAAGAASAETCPRGPAALDTGVTVVFDAMEVRYTRRADGRIHEVERHEDEASDWHYVTDPLGLVHESWEAGRDGVPDESTRERYGFVFPNGFPRAEPFGTWMGTETARTASGEVYEAMVSWRMGAPETLRVGACDYTVIGIVETRMDLPKRSGDLPWINHYLHVPELGLSLYLGGDEAGVDPVLEVPRAIR